MAEGRLRAEWKQTSSIMALLANCHGVKKEPGDYDPFKQAEPPLMVSVGDMKNIFLKGKRQGVKR